MPTLSCRGIATPLVYPGFPAFTAGKTFLRANSAQARSLQQPGMNEGPEDFAAKLVLIEREAKLVLEDVHSSLAHERVQALLTVAQLLRARLDVVSSLILAPQHANKEQEDFAAKLRSIEGDAKLVLGSLAPGTTRDRLQHIATVAQMLQARLGIPPRVSPSKGST